MFNICIGEKIQELRKANNISQEKLAEILGVSRQAVSKWEKSNSLPTTENMMALAKTFNISIEELAHSTKKVILVSDMKNELELMKTTSKKALISIGVLLLLFISSFAAALYGRISGSFDEKIILLLVLLSAGFMLSAYSIVLVKILKFVYNDCAKRGIKPFFWVLISITILGLVYYFLKREYISQ